MHYFTGDRGHGVMCGHDGMCDHDEMCDYDGNHAYAQDSNSETYSTST